jgi:dihydroxyacid dehydratase/phosphogluconate dehydratase
MTVTGKTMRENLQHAAELDFTTQDVIRPIEKPMKSTGHLRILKGYVLDSVAKRLVLTLSQQPLASRRRRKDHRQRRRLLLWQGHVL